MTPILRTVSVRTLRRWLIEFLLVSQKYQLLPVICFKAAFYRKSHIKLDRAFFKFETKLEGILCGKLNRFECEKAILSRFQVKNFQSFLGQNTPRSP